MMTVNLESVGQASSSTASHQSFITATDSNRNEQTLMCEIMGLSALEVIYPHP